VITTLKYILAVLVQMITGNKSEEVLYDQIFTRASIQLNQILESFSYRLLGITLVICGFLSSYFNILVQYDEHKSVIVTAVFIGGVILYFLGMAIIFNTNKKSNKQRFSSPTKAVTSKEAFASPLETALAALVLDFIKEREETRETKREKSNESANNTYEKNEKEFLHEIKIH
jgi:RsiW-degrading membrane proteinase PrsW (M82 family)